MAAQQLLIDELIAAAAACRRCGKAHAYRDVSTGALDLSGRPIKRFSWADPDDGHTYEHDAPGVVIDWLRAWKASHPA